jgi:hypothetical protein
MLRRQESAGKPLRGVVNTAAPYQLAQTVRLCLNILQNTVWKLLQIQVACRVDEAQLTLESLSAYSVVSL